MVLLKQEEICRICDTQYILVYEENPDIAKPEYCPFCGSLESDEIVVELAGSDDDEE